MIACLIECTDYKLAVTMVGLLTVQPITNYALYFRGGRLCPIWLLVKLYRVWCQGKIRYLYQALVKIDGMKILLK
jgi:hypothetical protein